MKYIRETKVMYGDTDSYKVVWHGNYLRWFEEGRFSLCKMAGVNVNELEDKGIVFPIVDMHVRYKSPAKIFEDIIIESTITDVKPRTVTFSQCIKNKKSEATLVTAEFVCVAVDTFGGKLQKLPEDIFKAFQNCIEQI
ncbi:MAG: acyl-CoA thioesterase [Candidatus Gastranaerophilales bacterium]|nr:acyl-CoA thioesterase [Candidatus Gastranaerophilales bacterium]